MRTPSAVDQVAALPFRMDSSGLKVLLVTSRSSKRWILPKGWPISGLMPHEAAAREAFEEAGVVGHASPSAVGQFQSQKTGKSGQPIATRVTVYALEVDAERSRWPEMAERERCWFSLQEAVRAVQNDQLKRIIFDFGKSVRADAQEREIAH